MSIKMLVMDVDGTLTDGCIYTSGSGELMKAFHVRDGYAIAHILPTANIVPVIITGKSSEIVKKRASELKITEVHQGISDKLPKLKEIANTYGLAPKEIAYIGDDVNDLECISFCGTSACPADAMEAVIAACDYVCRQNGGRGAVREFVDWLLK